MANRNQELRMEKELLLLKRNGFMSIGDLAKHCDISEITIRRDLQALSKVGKVQLVYGGATRIGPDSSMHDYQHNYERDKNIANKIAIAKAAVRFIEPHDVLFLDAGTTVQQMTRLITDDQPYTIVCYSLNIFETAMSLMNSRIIMPGGIFHRPSLIFSGEDSVSAIRRIRITKGFFGATGFHSELGITCNSAEGIALKRESYKNTLERILLIDSSKFGRVTPYHFASVPSLSTIITDCGIDPEYASPIRDQGIRLVIVDPDNPDAAID